MPQARNRVVISRWRRHLAKSSRPFVAVCFRDAPQFPICQSRPAFHQRDKNLSPVMPRTRLDRHVIGLVLLVNFERLAESHFRRCLAHTRNLLLPMLTQKFRQPRFGDREMCRAQTFPNLFIVVECARIIATGLMTHQILFSSLFPSFHGFVLVCTLTVEKSRRKVNMLFSTHRQVLRK